MSSTSGMSDWQREWLRRAFQAETTQGVFPVPVTTPTQTQGASTLDSFDLLTARRLAFLLWRMAREESGVDGYHIQEEAHDANG